MTLTTWLLLAALVDAAIGITALVMTSILLRGRIRITALEVTWAIVVTLAVGAMQAVVLLGQGFARLHIAYLVLVVSVPLVGAATAAMWSAARRTNRFAVSGTAAVMGMVSTGLAVLGFWSTHVEPYRLRTDRATLDVAQIERDDQPIRIGVIADLQTREIGDHEWRAVRRLNEAKPDVVVLPGDFIQGDEERSVAQNPELQRLLGSLSAPGGVYLVAGDADSPERLERIVAGTDLVGLDNDVASIDVRGQRLWIGGLENDYRSTEAAATIDELARSGEEGDLRLLVAHRPDAAYLTGDTGRIDLVATGHTHGGQVALPFVGPPIVMSDVPREVAAGGLHDLDGQAIYVGTGVGLERASAPQVRFLVPPSVGLVEVR